MLPPWAGRSLLTTYERGSTQSTALTLQVGGSASIALFAAGSGSRSCPQLASLTVYPTATVSGTGRTAALAQPVRICGAPRVLSFVPSNSGQVVALARGALTAAQQGAEVSQASSTGFYYGTDSSAPTASATAAAPTPSPGQLRQRRRSPYGEYMGKWDVHELAGLRLGLAWNRPTTTWPPPSGQVQYGLGATAYWFAAGPGRDP